MVEVNFVRRGSGSPLVLLHGVGHRWQAWRPVLDLLAEQHEVIAMDLPGFGLSPALPPGTPHDVPATMDRLAQVFASLGLDRPHVAGNSLGGVLSLEAASRGLVASATALSPAGFWNRLDRARALAILRLIRATALAPDSLTSAVLSNDRLRASFLRLLHEHPERVDRTTALGDVAALRASQAFTATLRSGRRYVWRADPPKVPITIAWGTQDRILPPRQARRAAQLLPDARHLMLPDCGHVPMIDAPELVARTILETCAQAERERSTPATDGATSASAEGETATQ